MPDLTATHTFLIVGAVYVDLHYDMPTAALKSDVDTQLFCEPSLRIGGTGFNQASILAQSIDTEKTIRLITFLGEDPVSILIRELVTRSASPFSIDVMAIPEVASPPIVTILRETLHSKSRRVMVGPPNRYVSRLWTTMNELNNLTIDREQSALIFDGYSLTNYELGFEQELRIFTGKFASSTLLLLPHKIYKVLDRNAFVNALTCFSNLESSFYTVSRILLGVGDTDIPSDELIVTTVRQLIADCPGCELNLRFGAMDAQYCAQYKGEAKITIVEYEIDHLGQRSVGDRLQIQEMVNPSALQEKHRRELSI